MASLFTKIVKGEIPCHRVAEDENYLAFLDIFPIQKGHTLVIPKQEVDYVYDLEDDVLAGLFVFSKRVAKAIEATITCERIGVGVVGLEVPHAHVHLIPINTMADMDFNQPKLSLETEEMVSIATQIQSHFQ